VHLPLLAHDATGDALLQTSRGLYSGRLNGYITNGAPVDHPSVKSAKRSYGYMQEQRVARAWADDRVTRIWAGSNEIMKEPIGRDVGF
jgi:alkylation response protein AidB-like acyl-CoA dehydrogenase